MDLDRIPGMLVATHVPYMVTVIFLLVTARRLRRSAEALEKALAEKERSS